MKKMLITVGIIAVILSAIIIGNKAHSLYQEDLARKEFLELIHSIEAEEIEIFSFVKANPDIYHLEYLDNTEYQRNKFCELLGSISKDEVSVGPGSQVFKSLDICIITTRNEAWVFRFDGEVIYMHGIPNELTEGGIVEEYSWEIRSESLNTFLNEILETIDKKEV